MLSPCFSPRQEGVGGVKSHLKEVGRSGQACPPPRASLIFGSLEPASRNASEHPRRVLETQDFGAGKWQWGKKGFGPHKELFLHTVINRGSQHPSLARPPACPLSNIFLICVAASCLLQATLIGNSVVHTESSSLLSEDTYRG